MTEGSGATSNDDSLHAGSATTGRRSDRRIRPLLLTVILVGYAVIGTFVAVSVWDRVQMATGWGLPIRHGVAMAIIAHRGDLERFPEDTEESILGATQRGADGIEFDVHRSATGTWYVIHDPTLDRTTDASGAIADLTDDIIDRAVIDGGLGFDAARHRDLHVPRLQDVLQGLRGYQGSVYLDLQHAKTGTARELLEVAGDTPHVVVICRTVRDALDVKAADPSVGTLIRAAWARSPDMVDGWLVEASGEATPRFVATSAIPVTTFVDGSRLDESEYPALRRAWASGVEAFLTNHLTAALDARDALAASDGSPADAP